MFKKLVATASFLIAVVTLLLWFVRNHLFPTPSSPAASLTNNDQTPIPSPSTTEALPSFSFTFTSLDLNSHHPPLTVYLGKIWPQANIRLIDNFSQKESGHSLAKKNNCRLAINGGFYTTDNKPLGLFVIDRKKINNFQKSSVANAFFWQDRQGLRHITSEPPPVEKTSFALQTGPLFPLPNHSLVKITNDKPDRRSLLGIDVEGNLHAIMMFDPADKFSGPNLADVPALLSRNEIREVTRLKTVINLDGGSASFFYSEAAPGPIVLSELALIGSLICVK